MIKNFETVKERRIHLRGFGNLNQPITTKKMELVIITGPHEKIV